MNITDAQGLAFLRQQTTVLSNRAFEQEYDLVNWAELVPVNTDYPEWASGVDFQVGDLTGAAQWQSGYAKDVPLADVSLISVSSQFAMYAVGYRYNVEEAGKAMFAGYPLTAAIEKLTLAGKEVFSISDGALLICLDRRLTLEVIDAMVARTPAMILCLDDGFRGNDQLKVNAVQTVKSRNQNDETDIVFRVV